MSNQENQIQKTPTVLCILDGWGIYHDYNGNAITQAQTPNFDMLWKEYSHTQIQASGKFVGLPEKEDGNSEAGHLNLGAGRIVKQDTVTVTEAIENGTFFKNPAFLSSVEHIKKSKSKLHLMGLLTGWQSAHADPNHIFALLKFYREQGIKNIYLHLFTDGRDSFQTGAADFLKKIEKELLPNEKIATISGRYYAMDRTNKWDRTEKVYNALVLGKASFYSKSAQEAIKQAYDRGETDEFILPTIIVKEGECDEKGVCISGKPVAHIDNNDAIIFFNLRSDRARQLTKSFVRPDFESKNPESFKRHKSLKNLSFVSMTDFGPDLNSVLSAFPSEDIKNSLPQTLKNLKQLYIAETEKFAHITYFFNGGFSDPISNEERKIIKSPDVSSYDKKPEMSAYEITDEILKSLQNNSHDFIAVNFANPDMVAHTGNLAAGIKAVEVIDECLGKIFTEIKNKNGLMFVVSDHGNAEEMIDEKTGEIDTQHSSYPVPFIIIDHRGSEIQKHNLAEQGFLANVAPTILQLLKIEKPKEMTAQSLII